MFVSDIHEYLLAMGRKWPILYFRKINGNWQYQFPIFSEAPSAEDDFFGRKVALDANAMVAQGESYIFGPYTGKSYYIDFATLGLNGNTVSDFNIYPNPSSSILNIYNPNGKVSNHLKVISLTGAILMDQCGAIEALDVYSLSSGLYFLQIEFNDGSKATKRFIRS